MEQQLTYIGTIKSSLKTLDDCPSRNLKMHLKQNY